MEKDNKRVIIWLLTGAFLVFVMVVVGGITRLTESGLSMTNFKFISDALPPMNETEWEAAFDQYKQYPEYQKLNSHFELDDFKDIYFWEWLHRLIGRIIGIVFIIPFLYFVIKKQLSGPTIKKSVILFVLGGFQGFLGWYMVKSGLVDNPDVSHYRLAAHLITAFLTFAYTLWVALDLIYPERKTRDKGIRNLIRAGMLVLTVQIIYGAFVAGLSAGLIHNHWPLMNEGAYMHQTVLIEQIPTWKNFIEGKSGVQFVHRNIAYLVVLMVFMIWYKTRKAILSPLQAKGINMMVFIVLAQFILGVFTLIYAVPLWLGVLHQVFAFFLLGTMTFVLHRFTK